jgi:hypothetical protein
MLLVFACSSFILLKYSQEAQIMRRLRHPTLTLFMGVSLEHPSVTLDACAVLCARTRVLWALQCGLLSDTSPLLLLCLLAV